MANVSPHALIDDVPHPTGSPADRDRSPPPTRRLDLTAASTLGLVGVAAAVSTGLWALLFLVLKV